MKDLHTPGPLPAETVTVWQTIRSHNNGLKRGCGLHYTPPCPTTEQITGTVSTHTHIKDCHTHTHIKVCDIRTHSNIKVRDKRTHTHTYIKDWTNMRTCHCNAFELLRHYWCWFWCRFMFLIDLMTSREATQNSVWAYGNEDHLSLHYQRAVKVTLMNDGINCSSVNGKRETSLFYLPTDEPESFK